MDRPQLVCFGSTCIDYYTDQDGGTPFVGGGPLNMAVHAAGLGIRSALVSAAGTDRYGQMFRDALNDHHVDDSHFYIRDGRSPLCEVRMQDSERILGDYEEGVLRDFRLSEEDIRFICGAEICVTDLWGNQGAAFRKIKRSAASLAFDCADRPDDPLAQEALRYADILFFSAEGDSHDLRAKMCSMMKRGRIVTATLSENGSVALDDDGFHLCGIVPCEKIVDTMGAGDSYIAGFLSGLIKGEPIQNCMEAGAREASRTLAHYGAFRQEGRI
ncbi:MAG: fructoselysine 6-kinase [Solobacterium sp.]|nr:fructoselysine 6-kinase [Solobacterium sp.]